MFFGYSKSDGITSNLYIHLYSPAGIAQQEKEKEKEKENTCILDRKYKSKYEGRLNCRYSK